MQRIERNQLDVQKWDALVERNFRAGFYSYSWYLDAVAENWCVIVNDDYSVGIAVPYTIRWGRKIAYTPIFVTYLTLLTKEKWDQENIETTWSTIKSEFPIIELCVLDAPFGAAHDKYTCQWLMRVGGRSVNSQAKRMLRKFEKFQGEIVENKEYAPILNIVRETLLGKFSGLTESSLKRLETLCAEAALRNCLQVVHIMQNAQVTGGIICFSNHQLDFYLKGACLEETKQAGGMYALINHVIEQGEHKKLPFDFGGSRVPGVKAFNENLGGETWYYSFYKLDHSPFWFRWLRSLRQRLR